MMLTRLAKLSAPLLAATLAAACDDNAVELPVPTTVTVTPAAAEFTALGSTVQFRAEVHDQHGEVMDVSWVVWSGGDPQVATVDSTGLATATGNGTATVTATVGSVSGSAAVTVEQRPSEVRVSPAADTLLAFGDTLRLTAEALDANGHAVADARFQWMSSDTLVVTVDSSGLATGGDLGQATVTATASGVAGRAQLSVQERTPTELAVAPDTVGMSALADTVRLRAEVRDQTGRVMEGVRVSWSSGDTLVATVDSAGLATATGNGTVAVTAAAGEASGNAMVTVEQVPMRVVVLPAEGAVGLGDTLRLSAEAFDGNGHMVAGAEFAWSSGEVAVAAVDESGLVTGVTVGTATITATTGGAEGSAQIRVENPDRAALVALYNATDGPNWVDNTNWLTDAPLGDWYGVSTDASGRVVGVDLSGSGRWDPERGQRVGHGLSGPIPPELGGLSNLRSLELAWNDLSGPIPPELGGLSNLRSLELTWNHLSGPIPPELGGLSNLRSLELAWNDLSGPIPPELGGLSNLRSLELTWNHLSGPIPPELGGLSRLTFLWLTGNELSGPIPSELGGLSNLEGLDLAHNALSGPIPPELGDLSNLKQLNLFNNQLSGSIPPELGTLSNLERLSLGFNLFTGVLPSTFLNLTLLTSLEWTCGPRRVCVPGTSDFVAWLSARNPVDAERGFGPLCNIADRAVLTGFYGFAGGNEWTESGGWLDGPALEEWHGVSTDSLGRVTALHLSGNVLSGALSAGISALGQLSSLRIDGNEHLGGRLPLSLSNLELDEFHYDGTDLCEPEDAEFRDWLDGIPSHRGTGVRCAELTDRDVLSALYGATGGGSWANNRNWLSEAPLDAWHGVELDEGGRVTRLYLGSNDLSGPIPPELSALSNLTNLDLYGNDLSGRIPPELSALSNLTNLDLYGNDLSGRIPPELGKLSNLTSLHLGGNDLLGQIPPELGNLPNLERLYLYGNDLSGRIPPELSELSNLTFLHLASNDLSGRIPPELSELSNLTFLHLASNDLSGPIPSEVGELSNLERLYLGVNYLSGPIPPKVGGLSNLTFLFLAWNDLSGPIPPELGELSNLEYLHLSHNELTGPIPPEFGGLASLRELELANNEALAGALPESLTGIRVESLQAGGTDLCAPHALQEWLASIPRRRIPLCGEPPAAYLVQAVQSRLHPVPLVAGEDALLRVFVTAATETTVGIPEVRARFYLNGSEEHVADIPRSSTPIPKEIDEGDLSKSANAEVPGRIVRPGLEMVIDIDPGGTLDASLGVPTRIPEEGRLAVEVREMPTLDLTVIPLLWSSDPDSAIIGLTRGMAADPEGHALLEETHVLLPVGDIDVTARAPVASTSNDAFDLLGQTEAIRVLEGGGGHYMGMMSGEVTSAAGVAYLGGRSSFSVPNSGVVAHELGHNMNLRHAPCGGAGGLDPSFPYRRGNIGAWGYDFRHAGMVPTTRKDHMSYCGPTWTSDYHFANALAHRLADEGPSSAALAAPVTSMLLWGGVDTTGTPFLNPAFIADAPPALPDSAGDWIVTGRDEAGREVFSLSFTMPVAQAEEADVSSFVFALPARPGWADALASVTLSGPDGTATLDRDSDMPMAILRDPVTGQVRGFLRDLPHETQAAAMAAAGRTVEPGLEVLFSRGLPDAAEWRR